MIVCQPESHSSHRIKLHYSQIKLPLISYYSSYGVGIYVSTAAKRDFAAKPTVLFLCSSLSTRFTVHSSATGVMFCPPVRARRVPHYPFSALFLWDLLSQLAAHTRIP